MENSTQTLKNNVSGDENQELKIEMRKPKRVIHCSDGVIEEFSDDDEVDKNNITQSVNTKSLKWGPWLLHYAWAGGSKTLEYCDYVGEGLASFLGITTPKYQLEISEHERLEAAKRKSDEENVGWMPKEENGSVPLVLAQPPTSQGTSTASI